MKNVTNLDFYSNGSNVAVYSQCTEIIEESSTSTIYEIDSSSDSDNDKLVIDMDSVNNYADVEKTIREEKSGSERESVDAEVSTQNIKKCQKCCKGFKSFSALTRHEKVECGRTMVKCKYCPYESPWMIHLQKHIYKKHIGDIKDEAQDY